MKSTVKSLNNGDVGADKSTVDPDKKKPAIYSAKQQNFGNPIMAGGKSFKSIVGK